MKRIISLVLIFALCLAGCSAPTAQPTLSANSSEAPIPSPAVRETTPPPDETPGAIQRMETLTGADIKYISSSFSNISAPELAAALNGAAHHEIDRPEDFVYTFFSLDAYLEGGPDIYSSNDEHFTLYAGLYENIVQVNYSNGNCGHEERFFLDSTLYWFLRNNYRTDLAIDAEDYERYRDVIEARARDTVEQSLNMIGEPEFSGYEIVRFVRTDTFETPESVYEVYSWDVAFTTDDYPHVVWAGGMYMDAEGRVRAREQNTYFVVKTDTTGAEKDFCFMSWGLYWGEDEAAIRENVLNSLKKAFAKPAESGE